MGDIAELMIEGKICSWCNIHFVKYHHYPVLCRSCFKEAMKDYNDEDDFLMDSALQKAIFEEI